MREKLKSLLLLLLTLSAVALFALNLLLALDDSRFPRLRELLGLAEMRPSYSSLSDDSPALAPARLGVLGQNGLWLAAGDRAEELLGEAMPILSEALGSVGRIETIRRQQFLDRLDKQGIYCSFTDPVPFYLLQYWWTGELGFADRQSCSALVLTDGGEGVELAFYDGAQDLFYLAETAAGRQRLTALCTRYDASNAFFAGQRDGWQMLPQWEPVWSGEVWFPSYTVTVPDLTLEGAVGSELIAAFSVNPYLAKVYKTTEGDVVYVDGHTALQFSRDGSITYTSTAEQGIPLELREGLSAREGRAYAAAQCRALLGNVLSAASCRMNLSVAASAAGEDGSFTFAFERVTGGAFVSEDEGWSALVTVEGGAVTAIRLLIRHLTPAQDVQLLPYRLAAALLDDACDGLYVRYTTDGERLVPGLYAMKGGASRGME